MVRFFTAAVFISAAALSNVEAFVPASHNQAVNLNRAITSCTANQPQTSTTLNAAPTMVIYWSIKTAIDTIAYGIGATDQVKGTGVWSGFELKRDDPKPEDDEEKKDDK